MLSKNLNVDASSIGMLMMSIKNCMSVATTVYAADSITRMVIDIVPSEVKEEYIEPIFYQVSQSAYNAYEAINDKYEQLTGVITEFFKAEGEL